jgi:transcriptional regulator GlxA family with amidase domain
VEPTIERDAAAMTWIAESVPHAKWVMAICSGALFLAQLGFLRGRRATTHHSDFELVQRLEPSVQIEQKKRFVRDGKFVTSAGISAGLDSSLFLVSELLGQDVAARTADWLEYLPDGWKSG